MKFIPIYMLTLACLVSPFHTPNVEGAILLVGMAICWQIILVKP